MPIRVLELFLILVGCTKWGRIMWEERVKQLISGRMLIIIKKSILKSPQRLCPLPGIFPSTFLQTVNNSKNSILNWVIKLNLMQLPWNSEVPRKTTVASPKPCANYASAVRKTVRNEFSSNLETLTSKMLSLVSMLGAPHEYI